MNPLIFLARRLWLACLIAYGEKTLIKQLAQVFVMTGIVALTDYQFDTYSDKSMRRAQTINETVLLMVSYSFLIFNMMTVEHSFSIGFVSIGITGLYMVSGLIISLFKTLGGVKASLRRKFIMRKYRRFRARL